VILVSWKKGNVSYPTVIIKLRRIMSLKKEKQNLAQISKGFA
jgi:hypothetical protein